MAEPTPEVTPEAAPDPIPDLTPDPQQAYNDRMDALYPPDNQPPPEAAEDVGGDEPADATPETPEEGGEIPTLEADDGGEFPTVEDDEEKAPDAAGEEEQQAASEADPEVEEVEVKTLDQLAEHLEQEDDEWLMGLSVTRKVRGEEVTKPLSEWIDEGQISEAAHSYMEEAKKKNAEITEFAENTKRELGNTVAELGGMVGLIEQQLQIEFDADMMKKLRVEDPAEWSAKMEEQKQRKAAIEDVKTLFRQKYEDTLGSITEAQQKALTEGLEEQQEVLLKRVPSWSGKKGADQAKKDVPQILEYLRNDGYSDAEIQVLTHKGHHMATVYKAWMYDKLKGNSDTASKRVTKIPKVMKPGSSKPPKKKATDRQGKSDSRIQSLYGD